MPYKHFVEDFIPSAVDRRQLVSTVQDAKRKLRGNQVIVLVKGFPRAQETFLRILSKALEGSIYYHRQNCLCYKNLLFKGASLDNCIGDDNYIIAVSTTGIQRIVHRNGKSFLAESYPEEDDFIIDYFKRFLLN